MKKLLVAVFALLCINAAYSQKFEKKIAASDKSIEDPKKGIAPKTWISRGELFYDIANEPIKSLVAGMNEESYKLTVTESDVTETTEKVGEKEYKVHIYPDKKVYFDNGVIVFWDVLKYEVKDPMQKAYESYEKAKSLDADGKNGKKIGANLKTLSVLAKNEGFNQYQLGKTENALTLFKLSLDASADPLVGETDSLIYYYTGVLAADMGKDAEAEKYLRKTVEIGYTENGDTYAALANVLNNQEKYEEARLLLERGMTINPENQQLIIALINNYMTTGKDPKDIIPLLHKAQESQPTNPSLYFAEGQLYEKLEDQENAVKGYKKSVEVDPNYFFGYYGLGIIHFNTAAKYTELAMTEKNNTEYERLLKVADEQLKTALPYFEKAFELNQNEKSVVQALKEINYRFRTENDTYKANADKYDELLKKM